MILWLAIFLLVVAISFVLAFQSMRDYREIPSSSSNDYGLFLIRNRASLTPQILDNMHKNLAKQSLIISIERLFKGLESALVIFGPREILKDYEALLDLLELEDYTEVDSSQINLWQVTMKSKSHFSKGFFKSLPLFSDSEQFWWQLTLLPQKEQPDRPKFFQSEIRAVVYSADQKRRSELSELIQNIASDELIKIPKPFSTEQMLNFYKQRSLIKDSSNPVLTSGELLKLSLL